jgi:A/G-specific adenine glycosylase
MILKASTRLLQQAIQHWYMVHRRPMPWRLPLGQKRNPWHVMLSEMMLQQTTVATVKGYFDTFIHRWPTVEDMAKSPLEDVLTAWSGLGYYARARNLYKACHDIMNHHHGMIPDTEQGLRTLPGIGEYAAASIAALAFDKRAVVIDANIRRIIARLIGFEEPLDKGKDALYKAADALTPNHNAGDHAEALMDIGATVCTSTNPHCLICPLAFGCVAYQQKTVHRIPIKPDKKTRPTRMGVCFIMTAEGHLWLRQRPDTGLLARMMEIPSTPWVETLPEVVQTFPVDGEWTALPATVVHIFTHFRLELTLMRLVLPKKIALPTGTWVALPDIPHYPLPTVMKKVLDTADVL